jgi:hypothetical protein
MTAPLEPPDPLPPSEPTFAPRTTPATSLLAAVKLMYVGAGLSLLGMLFALATRGQLRDQLMKKIQTRPLRSSIERSTWPAASAWSSG